MRKLLAVLVAFGLVWAIGTFMPGCDDGDTTTTTTVAPGTTTTTGAAALVAPTQISPANGLSISHFPRTTTLVWSSVAGAAKYGVETQYDDAGTWKALSAGTATPTNPTLTFDFIGAQKGRWRVWAIDSSNIDGPKTGWFEFTYTL